MSRLQPVDEILSEINQIKHELKSYDEMLVKKDFLTKDNMNKLKISSSETQIINQKNTFIDNFLSSLRQKINDPLGVKKAK